MDSKDEAFGYIRDLVMRLETKLPKDHIEANHSDNGTKFKNDHFKTFVLILILNINFLLHISAKNGDVERKNRTLIEMIRRMLSKHRLSYF